MHDEHEIYAEVINAITERLSALLIKRYEKLPEELQKGLVLVRSVQLLLANIICQVALNKNELDMLANAQNDDMKELIETCAVIKYAHKFGIVKH